MGVRRRGQGYGPAPDEGPAPRPAPAGRTPPTLAFSGAQGLRKGAKDGRRGRTTGAEARPPGRVGPEGPSALGASSRRRPSPWTEPTPCCGQRGEGRRLPRTRSSRPGRRRPIGPRPRPAASPEGRVRLTGVGAAVPPPTGTRAGARPDRPASIPSPALPRPRPPEGGRTGAEQGRTGAGGSRRSTRAFTHVGARPPRPVAGAPGPGPGQGRGVGMRPPSPAGAPTDPPPRLPKGGRGGARESGRRVGPLRAPRLPGGESETRRTRGLGVRPGRPAPEGEGRGRALGLGASMRRWRRSRRLRACGPAGGPRAPRAARPGRCLPPRSPPPPREGGRGGRGEGPGRGAAPAAAEARGVGTLRATDVCRALSRSWPPPPPPAGAQGEGAERGRGWDGPWRVHPGYGHDAVGEVRALPPPPRAGGGGERSGVLDSVPARPGRKMCPPQGSSHGGQALTTMV